MLLKFFVKSAQEVVFIDQQKFCPLQPGKAQIVLLVDRPVDRPTVIFLTVVPPVDRAKDHGRPPGRPAPTREWGDLSRLTARSTGQTTWPLCTSRAHRSTGTVDRPLVRSTVWSTASAVRAGFWEFKLSHFTFK